MQPLVGLSFLQRFPFCRPDDREGFDFKDSSELRSLKELEKVLLSSSLVVF